jgi:CHAT domain-containing protein
LPYGFLRQVDFHALPHSGKVLLAQLPVSYGLDLTEQSSQRRNKSANRRQRQALLVADPTGDLPATRLEATAIREALETSRQSWSVNLLQGSDASGARVRQGLATADLFHFAGHGDFRSADGWQSALLLTDGSQLTLGDILALPSAPRQVVLSGCETGRTMQESPIDNANGLAHAFVAAGSQAVVAALRPVNDRLAATLVSSFYREWQAGATAEVALQKAQIALYNDNPDQDWSSFRLIEP